MMAGENNQEMAVRWLQAIEYCGSHFAHSGLAERFVIQIGATNRENVTDRHQFLIWVINKAPASAANPMWVQALSLPRSDHETVTEKILDNLCRYAVMNLTDTIQLNRIAPRIEVVNETEK